jgi:hypothetical protein
VSVCLLFLRGLRKVNHRDQPVTVPANAKDYVATDGIGIRILSDCCVQEGAGISNAVTEGTLCPLCRTLLRVTAFNSSDISISGDRSCARYFLLVQWARELGANLIDHDS